MTDIVDAKKFVRVMMIGGFAFTLATAPTMLRANALQDASANPDATDPAQLPAPPTDAATVASDVVTTATEAATEAAIEAAPSAAVPLRPGEAILTTGTLIPVKIRETLSSKDTTADTRFSFVVDGDVLVGDYVAIPKGTIGTGVVKEVKKRGGFGKAGIMTLAFESLETADGQKVTLNGGMVQQGKQNRPFNGPASVENIMQTGNVLGGLGGMGIASAGAIAVGFLIKGDHAIIDPNAIGQAVVASDTALQNLSARTSGEAVAAEATAAETVSAAMEDATPAKDVIDSAEKAVEGATQTAHDPVPTPQR